MYSAEFPATLLETVYDLDDLVLPGSVRDRIGQVEERMRHRRVVVDDWGFGSNHDNTTGLTVLFHGPSGTGKTMAAALLAKSAGIPAYEVDLANLVSKYIGETTKNLERIFARAEREHCLLFFDEADAVFGKRGEVTDARDRYANQEVSYLLQRIETFPGTVILASNLLANIDEAFVRRIDLIIEFPPPGLRERTRLWNRVFPAATPVEESLDLDGVARDFELTGAQILAAAIDAAYRAAANGHVVSRHHLELAIRGQFDKSGLMPPRPT
jgi:SpoVK/Ycf46/Vps4 family AAA+-type ATPase